MLTTSPEFSEIMMGRNRIIDSYVYINGINYDSSKIINWEFHDTISFSDKFEIGTTVANTFELTLQNVSGNFDSLSVEPFIGLDTGGTYEYVTLGKFIVDEPTVMNVSSTQKNIKLFCYDWMLKLDVPYIWEAGDTDTIANIMTRISTLSGVLLSGSYPNTIVNKVEGYTCRDILGFVSSLMGGCGIINREGKIAIKKFKSPTSSVLTISGDHYFENGFNRGVENYTIGKVTGQDIAGNQYSTGTVTESTMELRFNNPFISQELVDAIGISLIGLSYVPFTMEWQGNAALEAGDNIRIDEYQVAAFNTVLMDSVITFPHFAMKSETRTEAKITNAAVSSNQTQIQIENSLIDFQEQIDEKEMKILKQPNPPENPVEGQIWVDTNTTPPKWKKWSGSVWADAVGIEADAIIAGIINAERIGVGTITGDKLSFNAIDGKTINSGVFITQPDSSNSFIKMYNQELAYYYDNDLVARMRASGQGNLALTISGSGRTFKLDLGTRLEVSGIATFLSTAYFTSMFLDGYPVATQNYVNSQGFYKYGDSPTFNIINGAGSFRVNSNGTINSIGTYNTTTSNAANMHVSSGGLFYRSSSSIKYKEDVEDLSENVYKKVMDLRPVWYRSKGEGDRKDWSYIGLIAEEVAEIEPKLVHFNELENGELEPDGVQYERLGVMLIPIIKKQQDEIDQLKERIKKLEDLLTPK
ncbi:tail fiber domain-containing protein [Micromonospora provocatoris]